MVPSVPSVLLGGFSSIIRGSRWFLQLPQCAWMVPQISSARLYGSGSAPGLFLQYHPCSWMVTPVSSSVSSCNKPRQHMTQSTHASASNEVTGSLLSGWFDYTLHLECASRVIFFFAVKLNIFFQNILSDNLRKWQSKAKAGKYNYTVQTLRTNVVLWTRNSPDPDPYRGRPLSRTTFFYDLNMPQFWANTGKKHQKCSSSEQNRTYILFLPRYTVYTISAKRQTLDT